MRYLKKLPVCLFGLVLFGAGTYLNIQANIGLSPWSALAAGISNISGMLYGDASLLIGLVIIGIDLLFREKIGIGSILNGVLIGKFVDLFDWLQLVPKLDNFWLGCLMLLCGQLLIAVGSYFYMRTALGCGPRDTLMVALGRRLGRFPIGVVRGSIEAVAALSGWLLGAKIGLGTLLSVLSIGLCIQLVFKMFRFDPKTLCHESLIDTFKRLFLRQSPPEKSGE